MEELDRIRQQIDETDSQMAALFLQRMEAVKKAAFCKRGLSMPVYAPDREQAMLRKNTARIPDPSLQPYYARFLKDILTISKQYQRELLDASSSEEAGGRAVSNIILTGMPGVGKTSIGTVLSERTGLTLVDTDEMIVRQAGRSIREIFETEGEEAFRDMESEIVRTLSGRQGLIIATGGGTILREENVQALKQSGKIFFLDQDVEELEVSDDRPLSDTREKLRELYQSRYALYRLTCDLSVPVCPSSEETADLLLLLRTYL